MNSVTQLIFLALIYSTISASGSVVNPADIIFGKKFNPNEIDNFDNSNQFIAGIAGGSNSTIKKHSYLAAINRDDKFIGSAIILNKNWLVTAAWNVFWTEAKTFTIRVGSSYADKGGKTYKVQSYILYPNYTNEWIYDIALIKLEKPLKFSKKGVNKVSLASKLPGNGQIAVVSGWGWDKISTAGTQVVKEAAVPVLDYASCKPSYHDVAGFTNYSFCTSKAGVGPCAKDFGSPLVVKIKGKAQLIGVYSGAYECAGTKYPPVYADVSKYKKWIEKIIKKSNEYELNETDQNEEEEEFFEEEEEDESNESDV